MIIGLTGGIATGKSNVSRFLAQHRYQIVDADRITHQVEAKGQPGLTAIINRFGRQYLRSDRTLNRAKLGQTVFANSQALKDLVRVIDPYIRGAIVKRLTLARRMTRHVVLDAPTLFENGYAYLTDRVVVVACDPAIQLLRLRRRDRLSITGAEHRMASQWPLTIKKELADIVINSNGSKAQTLGQVIDLVHQHQI